MRLGFSVQLSVDGKELDARLGALLEALHAQGSLAGAARSLGCSYRHAWDRLRAARDEYGEPLVWLERGRGARLSLFGEQLIAIRARARAGTAQTLARVARAGERDLGPKRTSTVPSVSIAASHDLALIELKQFCALARPPLTLDVRFRGSLEALAELTRGRCDLAGFHVGPAAHAEAALRGALTPRQHRLIILADRSQGLMVAPGNPKGIRRLPDLTRRGIRFVNRQPGSGTRMLFDRLLAEADCARAAIRGYDTEEFTHVAVAATVASGHADAGFGIEAAAASYGLDFVPMSRETYYLAARRVRIDHDTTRALIEHMTSPGWRKRLVRLRGYDASDCGAVVDVERAFRPIGSQAQLGKRPARAAVK